VFDDQIDWFVSMGEHKQQSMSLSGGQLAGYIALCLIWGSTWLAIRLVVRDVPPFEAAALRFVIAGVLLLGMAMAQKRPWPADEAQWTALLVLSLTMMAVPYGLLFWAEQYVTSSMSAVLYSAMPLTVSLFTPLMMRHKVPRRAIFAMVIAFGGLLTLFYQDLSKTREALIGGVAVLAAMLLSSWSAVYAKQRLRNVDSVIATGLQLLLGSLGLFWGMWALEKHRHAVWTETAVFALAYLTICGSAAAFVIYYWLLKKLQPYQLSSISLIIPLVALIAGLLEGEPVSWVMVIAIIAVLGSVRSVLVAEKEKDPEGDDILMLQDRTQ
jgi:drug/metabolite transporter (DMT)-like permease